MTSVSSRYALSAFQQASKLFSNRCIVASRTIFVGGSSRISARVLNARYATSSFSTPRLPSWLSPGETRANGRGLPGPHHRSHRCPRWLLANGRYSVDRTPHVERNRYRSRRAETRSGRDGMTTTPAFVASVPREAYSTTCTSTTPEPAAVRPIVSAAACERSNWRPAT